MPISDAFASLGRNRPAAIAMLALLCAVLGAAMLKVNGLFIVAGLAGLAAAYFLISFPFACVPIYYMLLYLRPGDVYPFLDKLRLILLIVALMGGAFLLRVLVFRTLRVLRNAQLIFIITLLGLIGLSIVDSFYRSASLAKFQEMARILLMVVLVVHIVDDFKSSKSWRGRSCCRCRIWRP
ncbi:MAG: hypothetical protein M5R36_03495 [Deltaproteobacteria bacterium]|nr:hypothetical protein [Deltaproteobacteria bacterium]